MSELSSLLGGGNQSQTDLLVQSFRQTQQPKIDNLKQKQTTLERRKSFFTGLNTRLNALVSALDAYDASGINDKFVTRKVTSTNKDVITASADGSALIGNNTVKVNRLATSDLLVSDQVNQDDDFGDFSGTFTLSLEINGEARSINVTLDNTETYEQALNKIATAINNEDDFNIQASVVNDTSSTTRLSLSTSETGEDNKILFTNTGDPATDLLLNIGLDASALNSSAASRTQFTDSSAGYKVSAVSELNSESEVNGITVIRSSNTLSDVLNGLEINLLDVQEASDNPVSLKTEIDVEEVKELINPVIREYNKVLEYLRNNKDQRRADLSVNSLFSNLRGISSSRVTGLADGAPDFLSSIGIKPDSDGKLSFKDEDLLEELLKENPQQVADIFTSSDGIIAKIEQTISTLKGDDDLIDTKRNSLQDQIDNYDDRIEQLQRRIDNQAANLREQYESLLSSFLEAEAQFSSFSAFGGGGGSFGGAGLGSFI